MEGTGGGAKEIAAAVEERSSESHCTARLVQQEALYKIVT